MSIHFLCFQLENGRGGTLLEVARRCERMGYEMHRSSHWRYSVRKGVLINFAKFTGKHLCQSLFFLFFVFSLNFENFQRTAFLQNTARRLLLKARNRSSSSHRRCSTKTLFLKILQYSQENACGVSF